MALKDEIEAAVGKIFKEQWKYRDGQVVPEAEDVALGNEGVTLEATVLYADLDGSTKMVDSYTPAFSAEIYKSFLYSTARVIRARGGEIVAYDGDRVMAVFIGDSKNTSAAKCALQINWTAKHLVMPLLKQQYTDTTFDLKHIVGVDTSELLVARTGVRGANDLVWVGPAANYAAKLTELSGFASWITHRVYDAMKDEAKLSNGREMWEKRTWTAMNGLAIYGSGWTWSL